MAQHVVTPADLYRLALQPDRAVHRFRIPLGPQKLLHAAERTADDQAQMGDPQPICHQLVRQVDHIVIAVMREVTLAAVGLRSRSAATSQRAGDDDVIFRRAERAGSSLNNSSASVGRNQLAPVPELHCNSNTALTASPAAFFFAVPIVGNAVSPRGGSVR